MGKITRRDLLRTGALVLSGAGLLVTVAEPTEAHTRVDAKPPTHAETALQVDVVPWALGQPDMPLQECCGEPWTLVLTVYEGVSDPPMCQPTQRHEVRSKSQRIVAIRGFRTWLPREEIMQGILERYGEFDPQSGWEHIADCMIAAVRATEDLIVAS